MKEMNNLKIVVVEDSPTQALQLQHVLEKVGFQVAAAGNGKEALSLLESGVSPKLVISDVLMPEMDGYELCKRLRADSRFRELPVILVTTLSDPKDVIRGLECGANNFIVKPYDEKHLVNRIHHLLSNFELRKNSKAEMGINVYFSGENYFITAERLQILDLLLSTYENAYHQNIELIMAQNELRDLNGRLEELVRDRTAALTEEIDERKRAEEALRASEVKYRRLFEAAKDGILILDADTGMIADVNPFLIELLGLSQEAFLGKAIWEIGFLSDIVANKANFLQLQKKGYVRYEDMPLEAADGRRLDVEFVSNTYEVSNRKVIQCNIRDITERKKAEKALDRIKNQYELILHSAGEGITGQDLEGKLTFVNPSAENMLGFTAKELIGKSSHVMLHHSRTDGAPYPEEACPFVRARREGKTYSDIDEVFWRKDGTSFPVEYIATPMIEGGSVTGVVVIFRDITQAKMLQEAEVSRLMADTANKAKSDFLANMSHELRTPLNSILGFSEVLVDELFGKLNAQQKEYTKDIYNSGKHLLDLINDILDLSKVESGKMELELSTFPLKDDLNAAINMFREKAMKHDLKLDIDIKPDADREIAADRRKFKQIMFNLLSNAVKFTPDGGSVQVTARKGIGDWGIGIENTGDRDLRLGVSEKGPIPVPQQPTPDRDFIEISVTDTGIGIKPDDMPKLFREFTQLESVYTKSIEGTGLGLVLTKRLVELHGGTIWGRSEFGKGSTFSFVIPISAEEKDDQDRSNTK